MTQLDRHPHLTLLLSIVLASALASAGCSDAGASDDDTADPGGDENLPEAVDPEHAGETLVPTEHDGETQIADPAPVPAGVVDPIESFEVTDVYDPAFSPVVAAAGGHRVVAVVDVKTQWPSVQIDGGEWLAAPGRDADGDARAGAVAVAASTDGTVHMTWDADGQIHYSWLSPEHASFGPLHILPSERARDATIALSDGEIVLAWTEDPDLEADPGSVAAIQVARGSLDDRGTLAFAPPRRANTGCCNAGDANYAAHDVSGPSLAVGPDGRAHVVYEWMTFGETVIDYTREMGEDRAFEAPIGVVSAAFSPCPALAVDEEAAHITYLLEYNQDVWHVAVHEDGTVSEPRAVYTEPNGSVLLALMKPDANGLMHFAVKTRTWGENAGENLIYVRDDGSAPIPIASEQELGFFVLSPRSGGIAFEDGHLLVPFERGHDNDDAGYAELGRSLVYAATLAPTP